MPSRSPSSACSVRSWVEALQQEFQVYDVRDAPDKMAALASVADLMLAEPFSPEAFMQLIRADDRPR